MVLPQNFKPMDVELQSRNQNFLVLYFVNDGLTFLIPGAVYSTNAVVCAVNMLKLIKDAPSHFINVVDVPTHAQDPRSLAKKSPPCYLL